MLVLRNSFKDICGDLKADIQEVRTKVDGIQQQIAGQGERFTRIEGMCCPHRSPG